MLPLREKMMAKRLQLDTMASMPNMNEEAIAKQPPRSLRFTRR